MYLVAFLCFKCIYSAGTFSKTKEQLITVSVSQPLVFYEAYLMPAFIFRLVTVTAVDVFIASLFPPIVLRITKPPI